MSTPFVIPTNRMLRDASWLFDHDLEAQDAAACAEYDRREAIERAVSFADVLEEAVDFTRPQQEAFMEALARGRSVDLHTIFCLLDQAKTRIVTRRVNGGV
ncbi:hypothetical protein [Paraburkholderia saeva]|uniref:hypothetical protein n=1 Tax=Paraburkholderia saeva TaxID=2777537 RepID=UPI001DFA2C3D|nr:hypothetical protein [Paraburkholderia saeva]CAG4887829.1 hypothetical protein R52603_00520 [Paraburkholderia saeva]